MSVPPGTEMFQFPGFASKPYLFRPRYPRKGGFPHSDIRGSTIARISPRLFAACHVLHRLLAPRHPPNALITLHIATSPPARRTKPRPNMQAHCNTKRSTHAIHSILPTNPSSLVKEQNPGSALRCQSQSFGSISRTKTTAPGRHRKVSPNTHQSKHIERGERSLPISR